MAANTYLARRPAVLGLAKVLCLVLAQVPAVKALPVHLSGLLRINGNDGAKKPDDPSLWIYLAVAATLVLLGGAFAGLTIALMGQDEIYLQVIRDSGEGAEKKNAGKVLRLLQRGKHWVLVTLLLSNVITNETLPIVLDRSLGGGWPAVLGSTVLIGMSIESWLPTSANSRVKSYLARSSLNLSASGMAYLLGHGCRPSSSRSCI